MEMIHEAPDKFTITPRNPDNESSSAANIFCLGMCHHQIIMTWIVRFLEPINAQTGMSWYFTDHLGVALEPGIYRRIFAF